MLVVFIPPSILVSSAIARSLSDIILFDGPRTKGLGWVRSVLTKFCPAREALSVSLMLRYRKFPYQEIYDDIEESPERQIQLFENLFDPTNENDSHETFFSTRKLEKNLILARRIFLEVEPVVYKGRFFAPETHFRFDNVYKRDKELATAMLRLVIKEQMGMVDDSYWLARFLKIAEKDHFYEIFKLLLDRQEMTGYAFGNFMDHWSGKEEKRLISGQYLNPHPGLPRDELLMRCALLSFIHQPQLYPECKGLEPGTNLDELRRVALERGDRQSISILFYYEYLDQHDDSRVSEMLKYVKLAGLSPETTECFVRWALYERKIGLADWPFEHLILQLSQNSRQVPKEDRLSKWLRRYVSMYEDVRVTGLDNLYDRPIKISINMRFTEPIEMDGRVVTRAAKYFILNAQAILDTYRSDQQALKVILAEDSRKIVMGTLYALAEGQHLDFTNTVLEMQEDKKGWAWFEHFAGDDDYRYEVNVALHYLNPDEIYEYVHKAEMKRCIQDEQVKETIRGISRLSVN